MAARPKLGILAGEGDLPLRIIEACRAEGRELFVLALSGEAEAQRFDGVPHASVRLGAAAEALRLLRENGVAELVLAGRVKRPSLAALRPDWRAAKLFARIGLRVLGDNGLLTAVIQELETEGFRVVGVDALLQPLLAEEGTLGGIAPDEQARADVARGLEVARALGGVDVGQSVVVQQGIVLGVEAAEGTDALVERAGGLRLEGPGGVLVKIAKPGQERRADLPVIGVATVVSCAKAGLGGIAVEAGAALVIDRARVIEAADRAGLFVLGIKAP